MMEVVKLNSVYPNPQPADILKIRVSVWMEDLGHLSEEMFLASVKLHRKTSKFFPTPADILECYKEVVINKPKPIALDEPHIELTQEEEEERKRLVANYKTKKNRSDII